MEFVTYVGQGLTTKLVFPLINNLQLKQFDPE